MKSRSTKEILTQEGKATLATLLGLNGEQVSNRVEELVKRTDQEWATLNLDYIINGMYSRNVLPPKIRELCAIAALTTLRSEVDLEIHIRCALRLNPVEEVREVILQMSVFAGMPSTQVALRVLEKVLAEGVTSQP